MKNKLFIFLILSSFNIQAQVSNRLLPVQNVHLNVSPNNFVYTVPPTDNRFYVASMDALRLKTFNVSGFNDTVKLVGDIRYKSISYVPSWSDVTSKPDLRTKSQNDTYYKDISYAPTKSDLGLSNVDNTSDLSKPISTAVQTALNGKLSAEIDGSITNELQTLSIVGNNLSISSGNTVTIPQNIYTSGTGINISSNVITNSLPDQTVTINGTNGIQINGSYPFFSVTKKKQETYSGTTNASGVYSVNFGTSYLVIPNIQANIIGGTPNQTITMNVTNNGFTCTVYQRNTVNLLSTELLLGTTVLVNGAKIDVLITEK